MDEWIPIVREKYGKKTFQNHEFLNISCEAEIQTISKPQNEWIPILRKKYGKTGNSQVLLYLTDLELVGTHASPNVRECANSYNMEIFLWKAISLPGCEFLRKLELTRKPKPSPKYESSKISCYGNTIAKTTLFPYYGLWLKINRVRQPIKFPDMGNYNPGQNIWNKIE